jgi:hypothetical protein
MGVDTRRLEDGRKLEEDDGTELEDGGELEDGSVPVGGVGPAEDTKLEDGCELVKDPKLEGCPCAEDDMVFRNGPTLLPFSSDGGGIRLCWTLSLSCSNLFLSIASVARSSALTCSNLSTCDATPSASSRPGPSPSVRWPSSAHPPIAAMIAARYSRCSRLTRDDCALLCSWYVEACLSWGVFYD